MKNVSSGGGRSGATPLPVFNYLARSLPGSLYRNGRVSLRRAPDGDDSELEGYVADPREMRVRDARELEGEGRPSLDREGFERVDQAVPPDLDFLDLEAVVRRYYPACEELLRSITGATQVFAFDHNVRWAEGRREGARSQGGQNVQAPIRMVHGDYTLTSAPRRLRDLSRPPRLNDTLRPFLDEGASLIPQGLAERAFAPGGRFALINVWRNIAAEPVRRDPLAFCDAASVRVEDLAVLELHYADRIGENYLTHHADGHRWFYYSSLLRDEAVLIKQWDSAGAFARSQGERADRAGSPCTMNLHSAFEDPATPDDAPARRSVEVRCAVIFEGSSNPATEGRPS